MAYSHETTVRHGQRDIYDQQPFIIFTPPLDRREEKNNKKKKEI